MTTSAGTSVAEVVIPVGRARLRGTLSWAEPGAGVVLFAHGSGSGRHSSRNRFVASELGRSGLSTLLFDLLAEREEDDRARVFDIPLLAERLLGAVRWVVADTRVATASIGLFGASTGAAAALAAAAEEPAVRAVVSRGGRPDLAQRWLERVAAPTLLIVGGDDPLVLDLNRVAMRGMRCTAELAVVPGATHLFEEMGALERVAELAGQWFVRYLMPGGGR